MATLVYGLTLSAVPALTHDSMTYLLAIQDGGDALFHPHHLAYNALSRVWLDLLGGLGVDGDLLPAVAAMNAVLGGCAAALVWALLRLRAHVALPAALAGTSGVALSFGVWFYSVSVEVYLLPLVVLLATLLVLTAPDLKARRIVLVGLLAGLAVVAHQVNVLFAVVVVAVLARGVAPGDTARRVALFGGTATGLVVAAYAAVLAFAVRPASTGAAVDWFTRYAQSDGYWHLQPSAPVQAASGLGRALVGGHFAYRLEPVRDRIASAFPGKSLQDEIFLVRHLPPALAAGLIVVAAVGAVLLAAVLVGGLRARRDLAAPARRLMLPLVVWLLVYSTFFLVWEPTNPEFWIPQVTVLWMIAAVLADRPAPATADRPDRSRLRAGLLAGAALAVGSANLVGTALPARDAANDVYAVRYDGLDAAVGAGDLVIVDHAHLGVGYTRRATEAEPVPVGGYTFRVEPRAEEGPSPDDLARRTAQALRAGRRVAIDAHLVDEPGDRTAQEAGEALATRFADRWRHLDIPDAPGWYLLGPA